MADAFFLSSKMEAGSGKLVIDNHEELVAKIILYTSATSVVHNISASVVVSFKSLVCI